MQGNERRRSGTMTLMADIWELAWFPLALAILASGITWAVWNFTTEPCTPELSETTKCSLSGWARFINLDLLNKMFTHGAIAGGTGGIWNYVMLRRERQRAELAEKLLDEERRRADEDRRRAEEDRRKADEERQRLLERIETLQARVNGGDGDQDQP